MGELIAISEIFLAPQGEGSLMGRPMVFVRVQGCNFVCVWCDTAYAIPMLGLDKVGWTLDAVVEKVVELAPDGLRWVSFTGGEPTVHKNLMPVVQRLLAKGYEVNIETNASVPPQRYADILESVFWSTSPKMSSSGMQDRPTPLVDRLVKLGPDARWQAKFVIKDQADFDEALMYCTDHGIPKGQIWMQPCTLEGQTRDEYGAAFRWLTETAAPFGLNVTVQQHSIAYGREARGI